jgi:hypothetical protein
MALTIPGATAAIAAGLVTGLLIGPGAIKLATGIATGLCTWIPGVPVITADTGTAGVGVGVIPLVIAPPLLFGGLTAGFAAQAIIGPMAPLTVTGITTGLVQACALAQVISQHPGVGSGACTVTFGPYSAIPSMILGFAAVGMVTPGSIMMATAIGLGLDICFSSLSLPSPIAGPSGPSPAAGVGFGVIV